MRMHGTKLDQMAREEDREEGELDMDTYDDENEDEANADLTLDIVAKAHRRPPTELSLSPKTKEFFASEEKLDALKEEASDADAVANDRERKLKRRTVVPAEGIVKRKRKHVEDSDEDGKVIVDKSGRTFVVQGKGTSMSDPVLILEQTADLDIKAADKPQGIEMKKKKKKKKSKRQNDDEPVVEPTVVASVLKEVSSQEESITVRKLLRAPRYFDPPEEIEAEACFNCGEAGHFAANCTAERRRRPCYVCGELSHEGKDCPQKSECYICGKVGHIAKACLQKRKNGGGRHAERVCLHCGDSSHETSSCRRGYDPEDIKVMQCYVCKRFGHLCCLDGLDNFPRQASCYNCGDMGHTGMGCAKSRKGASDGKAPQQCYKCGGEGHFARGCTQTGQGRAPWPAPWPADEGGSEEDLPRGQRLPRWMEIQMRNRQQKNTQDFDPRNRYSSPQRKYQHKYENGSSKKQKPIAQLVHENAALRLPKWYEMEFNSQKGLSNDRKPQNGRTNFNKHKHFSE